MRNKDSSCRPRAAALGSAAFLALFLPASALAAENGGTVYLQRNLVSNGAIPA